MATAYVLPIGHAPPLVSATTSSFTGRQLRPGCACTLPRRTRATHQPMQMNLFERFFRVIRANVNQAVTGMEDPEKILNQTVTDMQGDLVKVRQAYAEVSATLKRIQRQKEQAAVTSTEWRKRAQLALQKGEEDLAREALVRKKAADEQEASLGSQIDGMKSNVDKLYSSMQQLENKISEARSKKDQFVARARTAKTSAKVNDMLGSVSTSGALDAFERMKVKVEELEEQADVSRELSIGGAADVSLESKFKALESDNVDEELQKMKGQLSGSNVPFRLPGKVDPDVEGELERMKRGM